jgi:hypothetical protein
MNTWTSLNGEDHSIEWTGLEYLTLTIPDKSFIHHLIRIFRALINLN